MSLAVHVRVRAPTSAEVALGPDALIAAPRIDGAAATINQVTGALPDESFGPFAGVYDPAVTNEDFHDRSGIRGRAAAIAATGGTLGVVCFGAGASGRSRTLLGRSLPAVATPYPRGAADAAPLAPDVPPPPGIVELTVQQWLAPKVLPAGVFPRLRALRFDRDGRVQSLLNTSTTPRDFGASADEKPADAAPIDVTQVVASNGLVDYAPHEGESGAPLPPSVSVGVDVRCAAGLQAALRTVARMIGPVGGTDATLVLEVELVSDDLLAARRAVAAAEEEYKRLHAAKSAHEKRLAHAGAAGTAGARERSDLSALHASVADAASAAKRRLASVRASANALIDRLPPCVFGLVAFVDLAAHGTGTSPTVSLDASASASLSAAITTKSSSPREHARQRPGPQHTNCLLQCLGLPTLPVLAASSTRFDASRSVASTGSRSVSPGSTSGGASAKSLKPLTNALASCLPTTEDGTATAVVIGHVGPRTATAADTVDALHCLRQMAEC